MKTIKRFFNQVKKYIHDKFLYGKTIHNLKQELDKQEKYRIRQYSIHTVVPVGYPTNDMIVNKVIDFLKDDPMFRNYILNNSTGIKDKIVYTNTNRYKTEFPIGFLEDSFTKDSFINFL